MGFIYKITNDINDKIYIGKTNFSIEKRFQEHCRDAVKAHMEKRPLYRAMQKYGIDKFHIELIEETDDTENREIYWIKFFNSYEKGYNATLGGDSKNLYDHHLILTRLIEHPYPCDVAEEFGCCRDIVYDIAKQYHISVKHKAQEQQRSLLSKQIIAYTKQLEFVKEFSSTADAARWCFESGKCSSLNSGVRSHISEVANGKRKSAYGYIWKYK